MMATTPTPPTIKPTLESASIREEKSLRHAAVRFSQELVARDEVEVVLLARLEAAMPGAQAPRWTWSIVAPWPRPVAAREDHRDFFDPAAWPKSAVRTKVWCGITMLGEPPPSWNSVGRVLVRCRPTVKGEPKILIALPMPSSPSSCISAAAALSVITATYAADASSIGLEIPAVDQRGCLPPIPNQLGSIPCTPTASSACGFGTRSVTHDRFADVHVGDIRETANLLGLVARQEPASFRT